MKNIYILALLLLVGVSLKSQINLNTQHLGTQTYDIAAPEYVRMLPGFQYIPQSTNYFKAYIDPNASLVLPIEYVENPIDPENREINTSYEVGSTAGQASVSLSGGATYTIPIFAPPGTAGMQPSVSLVYNSQGGNGIAGYGWNISGLSAITRVGHTLYHDGVVEGINYNDDRFALDGQRLIKVSGEYGADGTSYSTEIFNGSKIISHWTNEDPASEFLLWFEVIGKDGSITEFGRTDNACLTHNDGPPIAYYINKITDPNGNYIEFIYNKRNSEINIKEIHYTGNNINVPKIIPFNSIKFYYKERTDKSTVFLTDSRIEQNLLLDHIDIVAEDKIIKVYKLKHYFDFYSKLNEVEEFGLNSERYNSLVFGYGKSGTPTTLKSLPIPRGNEVLYRDLDGDGLTDIYTTDNPTGSDLTWQIYINQGNGVFSPTPSFNGNLNDNRDYQSILCDVNGDSYTDILLKSQWEDLGGVGDHHFSLQLLLNTGTDFTSFDILNEDDVFPNSDDFSTSVSIMDINGDNKDEFVLWAKEKSLGDWDEEIRIYNVEINSGTLTKSLFSTIDLGYNEVDKLYPIDFNGDGKDELMVARKDNITNIYKFTTQNNIDYTTNEIYSEGFPSIYHKVYPGDYNGDGRADLLTKVVDSQNQKRWHLYYWVEGSFIEHEVVGILPPDVDDIDIADYNTDGKSDVLAFIPEDGGTSTKLSTKIYLSIQNSFVPQTPFFIGYISSYSWVTRRQYYQTIDFNGDGINDVGFNLPSNIHLILNTPWENTKVLEMVADGLNAKTKYQYTTLSNELVYTRNELLAYPLNTLGYPLPVVQTISTDNGLTGYISNTYKYSNGIIHMQGKGFIGFKEIERSTSISPIHAVSKSEINTNYYFLSPTESLSYKYDNYMQKVSISEAISTNQVKNGFETTNKVFLPWQSLVTEKDFVTGNKKTTELTTDNYGNPLTQKVKFFDSHSATTEKAYNQIEYQDYWSAVGNIASKPQTIINTSYRIEQALITQTQTIKYDTKGNIEHTIDFFGRTNEVKTTYTEPTSVGLPKTTTVSALGIQDRVSHKEFDSKYRFVSSQTDAEGYVSSTQYDPAFGNKLSVTNANEQTISMEYNGFGAPIRETDDFGVWTKTDLKWYTGSTKPNVLYYTESTSNNGLPSTKYYDKLGRTLYATSTDPNGMVSCTKTQYNSKGQAISVSEPYFEGTSPTQYTTTIYHPDYGFPLSTSLPTGVIVTSSTPTPESPGRVSSVTNSVTLITTSKEVDCTGKIIAATDPGGTLNYIYYSDGQTKQINAPDGSNVSMTYDIYGRQQTLSDPDAGIITYTYDALGQLIQQEDANGSIFMMWYDKLGRLIEKESEKNNQVANQVYIYYPATAAKGSRGALNYTHYADEENADTRDTYQYNDKGQLTQKTTVTDNNTISFSYLYSYDTKGNLDEYTYPSGYTIKNEYNSENGTFERVKEKLSGKIIYAPGSYNARGQMDHYSIANQSMYTRTEYDPYGLPTFVKTGHSYPGSTGVQYLETQFDAQTGNLNYRKDYHYQVNGQVLSETFTYDPVHKNRLATWQVTGQQQYTMTYADNNGNVLTKSDITSANNPYQYTGSKPHAVTSIQAPLLLPAENLQTIEYNHFNSVKQIMHNAEGKRLVLHYGTDGQRIKTQYFTQNITLAETKYFLGGDYEVEVNHATGSQRRIHYLPGGGMYVLDQNSSGNLYYILTDYQGNWHKVINEQGNTIEQYSFDAWGKRRNATNWSYIGVPTAFIFDRGYTGHEMLDAFGLINMNGRVYDPVIARFLSPDNYVQLPDNSQGFNRYSYCINNPLRYTDPGGQWFGADDAVVAGVGFVFGYVSYGITNGDWGKQAFINGGMMAASAWIGYNTCGIATAGQGLTSASTPAMMNYIGSMTINTVASSIMPSMNIPISNNFSISISPGFGLGPNGLSGGINVAGTYANGDWTVSGGFGANDLGYSVSGGASYYDKETRKRYSYYINYFGGRSDGHNQMVGGIGYSRDDYSFRWENDFFAHSGDKWRTNAMEFGYKKFVIGTNLWTNDPKGEKSAVDNEGRSKVWGRNWFGKGAWEDGITYSSPLYIGLRTGNGVTRIGIDHPLVQEFTQNFIHKFSGVGSQNFYNKYAHENARPYSQSGYYNPFSLYYY
jgi:RHS repeat-associated protein